MSSSKSVLINIDEIEAFVFDFDGVLTNNIVHIDQDGREFVSCNRSDGLAFDAIRELNKPSYIISTEENQVVTARANKLKIPVLQGVSDKAAELKKIAIKNSINLANIIYVGNDINDYRVMQLCGFSVCPSDSHKHIRNISKVVLKSKGGHGVVRELLEDVLQLDLIKILYLTESEN